MYEKLTTADYNNFIILSKIMKKKIEVPRSTLALRKNEFNINRYKCNGICKQIYNI